MKNLLLTLCYFLLTAGLYAQAPDQISFQAVIRDGADNLLSDWRVGESPHDPLLAPIRYYAETFVQEPSLARKFPAMLGVCAR